MEFNEYLKKDIERIGCSLSDLSRASGLSSAVISRYRSGERSPRRDSEMLIQLCDGLSKLEAAAGLEPRGEERLQQYRSIIGNKPSLLPEHLDQLLRTLHISMKDLSYILNYDASYLSRIRSGKRSPADPIAFAEHVSHALFDTLKPQEKELVMSLTDCRDPEHAEEALAAWLIQKEPVEDEQIQRFLNTIDSFNLNQFIRFISFSDSNAGGSVLSEGQEAVYYGTAGMQNAELDFFRTVLDAGQCGPIYMCNDLPMEEMAKDITFVKQWMTLIGECLKKGNQIHIIHDVNRPFQEMMMGLESWIPLYMTGQILPYYLSVPNSAIYHHSLYISDICALDGQAIGSTTEVAATTLSRDPKRLDYERKRAKVLFSQANPLMKIIQGSDYDEFARFWNSEANYSGTRYIKAAVPPIYSMTRDLLAKILDDCGADEQARKEADQTRISQLNIINRILRSSNISFDLLSLTKEEFNRSAPSPDTPFFRIAPQIRYSWENYQKHVELTREFAATHPGFTLQEQNDIVFRNLFIYVRDHRLAAIVKQKEPQICFAITNPRMVSAIRQFTAPFNEFE